MMRTITVYIYGNEAYSEREAEIFAEEQVSEEISNNEVLDVMLDNTNIDLFELFSKENHTMFADACEAFAEAKQELVRDWIDNNMYDSYIEIEI